MNSTRRILVRNIPPGTASDVLKRTFGKYGEIKEVHIPQGVNNRGQSYAFVEFQTTKDAEAAFDVLNNTSLNGSVIHCQFVEAREQHTIRRKDVRDSNPAPFVPLPSPAHMDYGKPSSTSIPAKGAVPQPAPLLAAAPLNPAMEISRYNTAAGGEFTIDGTGRLTRRSQLEEEQRTGRARSPVSQNPLLVQSAITIASAEKPIDEGVNGAAARSGIMALVKTHPQLVIDYADI